ncbi:hypothetical protein B0H12DRAFT_1240800 [Mycena haematopus]|nr:hypothetical protein B0H12DRAFT_1240800 [Mycena haematopus]
MIDHARRKTLAQLRLIDWGLAELYHPGTEYHQYDYSLDLWSTGCILVAMIFRKQHFFRGADNEDQLLKILRVLRTERFDAYLRAWDIPYETDVEELLGL